MKKQKTTLSLKKQKISSLSSKQVQGGNFTVQIITLQANCVTFRLDCRSLLQICGPIITGPSGCTSCPTTGPTTVQTTITQPDTILTMTTC
ncbi:hypothetical protein [uncultured Kordia sp.]|uniref:hypothetical protein n=1 Tax=uncultured Kordia sp. TaxID=507699 RepID=UPI00260F67B8|nr:hypothetical protein [uncultured Kordia sp.]